ncbi:MAG: hypothetical protein GY820_18885 [Gammaproteobacteria bacterium]|nr:hypothetical protein [Gammaproteobacteria bacterium]
MTKRQVLGVLISPLITPLIVIVAISGSSIFSSWDGFLESFFPVAVIALPISYIVCFVIGLPVFYLLRKLGFLNLFTVILSALTIPVLIMMLIMKLSGGSNTAVFADALVAYGMVSGCGLFVALFFWLIAFGFKLR